MPLEERVTIQFNEVTESSLQEFNSQQSGNYYLELLSWGRGSGADKAAIDPLLGMLTVIRKVTGIPGDNQHYKISTVIGVNPDANTSNVLDRIGHSLDGKLDKGAYRVHDILGDGYCLFVKDTPSPRRFSYHLYSDMEVKSALDFNILIGRYFRMLQRVVNQLFQGYGTTPLETTIQVIPRLSMIDNMQHYADKLFGRVPFTLETSVGRPIISDEIAGA